MRLALVVSVVVGLGLPALAQVAIEHQPADVPVWYRGAVERVTAGRLEQKQLLALTPGKIPAALKDDLLAKDWVILGGYSYAGKDLSPGYAENKPCELHVQRYQPDGGELYFAYTAACKDREHGKLEHTNFEGRVRPKVTLSELDGATYLAYETDGRKELQRVVSYAGGVLVLDLSKDGKAASKQIMERVVWIAIPQGFDWVPPPSKK